MDICGHIDSLIAYGLERSLIESTDVIYVRNRLLDKLNLTSYAESADAVEPGASLEDTLDALVSYAVEHGIAEDSGSSRERFGTAVMDILTPRPSQVIREFRQRYAISPQSATDYFYELCHDSDYISRYRTARDIKWLADTEYGKLEITINLSKPEKDPRDIAKARLAPQSGYPKCLLCVENEGYAGTASHPARHNHRIIPIDVAGEDWGFQYSPYVYYNEHCIILNREHTPMVIDRQAFIKLLSFVQKFPHYFAGSNADLPIVGGSILSHEHFQGGRHVFAMERAPIEREFAIRGFADVRAGTVKWPMTVIRISHENPERLAGAAALVLDNWRGYMDESAFIYAFTDGTPHNTVTPIARMRDGEFELDLVLRNNITTQEHPLGLYHPHEELHNIKKENIGIIEVMGLAVLPARLAVEMNALKECLLSGTDLRSLELTAKHADWYEGWGGGYGTLIPDKLDAAVRREIGRSFAKVLEHAGVFKRNDSGASAFSRFLESIA